MWPSIDQIWCPFTDQFEGCLDYMYPDVKGLVSTGRGFLIDPLETAFTLPWLVPPDSHPASQLEIASEWQKMKALGATPAREFGGGYFKRHATLFLPQRSIDAWTQAKLAANDEWLTKRFPWYSALPADAQLALLSLAWACGPAFNFPKMQAAFAAGNLASYQSAPGVAPLTLAPGCAAFEIKENETGNPGLVPRDAANQRLLEAAQQVIINGLDPSVIHGQWQRNPPAVPQ